MGDEMKEVAKFELRGESGWGNTLGYGNLICSIGGTDVKWVDESFSSRTKFCGYMSYLGRPTGGTDLDAARGLVTWMDQNGHKRVHRAIMAIFWDLPAVSYGNFDHFGWRAFGPLPTTVHKLRSAAGALASWGFRPIADRATGEPFDVPDYFHCEG